MKFMLSLVKFFFNGKKNKDIYVMNFFSCCPYKRDESGMIRKQLFILILRALSEDAQQYAIATCRSIKAWDGETMDL